MAYFRCGGAGIPSSLKTGMDQVLNKKFGTSTTYPPTGWPDDVNLMGPLEEKTVSGSLVAFSDGADDVPLKSCNVTIAPTLDGISSVDVVHGGANIWNEQWEQGSYNTDTGEPGYSSTRIRSKDDIYVKGVSSIYIVSPENIRCIFMDENKNVLGSPSAVHNGVVTPTTGAVYMRWYTGAGYGGTYNNDISFNLDITDTVYHAYNGTTHTASLGRTIYGGSVDVVNGTGTDENGNDFTFTPTPIISRLGDNTMWGDGDLSVVYRSSGTETIITPTLISKIITENGTYSAEDDNADGYDEVTVNVQGGYANIETVLSSNPLIKVTGVSGTDVSRTMWTYTATASGKIVFHANTQVKTNTGANDGFFTVKKNNTVIATTYANTNTTTSLVIPDIDIISGDVVTVECGFDNYHTSAWFDIYSTITILTESTPSLLMGGFNSSNEPENEVNELENELNELEQEGSET